jgi:hypothetical protein
MARLFSTPDSLMLSFNRFVTVSISPEAIQRAKEFAAQVTPTVGIPGRGYADTHQQDLEKIQHDHFVSKVGEEAVKAVFQQLGRQVQGPDYQIYAGKHKSWAADLWIDGVGLAVKTQTTTAAAKFGLSWTFQAGAYRYDPLLNQPEAWVCFVEFDEQNQSCVVCPPHQIQELAFAEPKLAKLQGSKKVVYATRLPARRLPQTA